MSKNESWFVNTQLQNIRISLTVPTYDGATKSKIPFCVRQISYCITKHNIVWQFANTLITDIKWSKFCLIIMKGEAVHTLCFTIRSIFILR